VPGDYLGVFYQDQSGIIQCGGFVLYPGYATSLTAYGDNASTPQKDGFYNGDEFIWKVWQASTQLEYNATAVYLPVGTPGILNEQYYSNNGVSGISQLYAFTPAIQCIDLDAWCIISTYINPFIVNIANIFAPVINQLYIVKDGAGLVYWPLYNINNIGNITTGKGYFVKMNVPATLCINGIAIIPEQTPVNIPSGWSTLGYLRQQPANISVLLASIAAQVIICKNEDGWIWWPQFNLNSIGNMLPGKGYQIKLSSTVTYTYPPNNQCVEKTYFNFPLPYFYNDVRITDNNMTVGLDCSSLNIVAGTEAVIFTTDGILAGSAILNNNFTAITIWGDDKYTTEKDGFIEGEPFIIKFLNPLTHEERGITVESWLEGNGQYMINGISITGKLKMEDENPQLTMLYNCTPNPCNENTTVSFDLPEISTVILYVADLPGQEISVIVSGTLDAGKYKFPIDTRSLMQGIYFINLLTKDGVFTGKIIVSH
jgi:hypothetical protein